MGFRLRAAPLREVLSQEHKQRTLERKPKLDWRGIDQQPATCQCGQAWGDRGLREVSPNRARRRDGAQQSQIQQHVTRPAPGRAGEA